MDILIGTPVKLIYEDGTYSGSEPLYYLGQHTYGWLTENGFEAAGVTDNVKYVVPCELWNDDYKKVKETDLWGHERIDWDRFKGGHDYSDFLPDKITDIDVPHLHEYPWYEKMKESIKKVREFYDSTLNQ